MRALPVYAADAGDFSSNGLALLQPLTCSVEGRGNDLYELKIELPIDAYSHWERVQCGCVIKAPCPVRDSLDSGGSVARDVYRVNVQTHLRLRQKPSTSSKILGSYAAGVEVMQLAPAESGWMEVYVFRDGLRGYMSTRYLVYSRTIDAGDDPTQPHVARDQLFRLYSVDVKTGEGVVSASAQHIFYDLRGNLIDAELKLKDTPAASAVQQVFASLLNESPFTVHIGAIQGTVTGDYGYKSPVEALLGSDGILSQCNALLIRDNFDIWVLPDAAPDLGVTIRRGKNLTGVTVSTDTSEVVTRIIPVGHKQNSDPLYLNGTKYIDSERAGDYPIIYAKRVEYDIKVGDEDYSTEAAARAALRQKVADEYAAGCDQPAYGLDVDFVMPETHDELVALQAVHLFDTVTVIDELIGLNAKVRVNEYEWNILSEQYDKLTLGTMIDY